MTAEAWIALLARRLVIVTGKGGTGKTTVSAALALAAAGRGKRTLAVEVGRDEQLPALLGGGASPVGPGGRELLPRLTAMRIDPFDALSEYLGLQLGVRAIPEMALRNRGFRQLMEASPGWRELITLGKVWHLEQQRTQSGDPLYELIVVDAPATGHGVTFLDVPRVVRSAIRAGPLRRHAGLVEDMIRDEQRTVLLPVALAEELPTRETAELVARATDEVGIAIDRVVVNGVAQSPFPAGLENLDDLLDGVPADAPLGDLPPAPALAACARYLRSRFELNREYVSEIAERTRLPVVCLPNLPRGVHGRDELTELAEALLVGEPAENGSPAEALG